jgi:hypothetical protein
MWHATACCFHVLPLVHVSLQPNTIMKLRYYLLLPAGMLERGSSHLPLGWRRRAVHSAYLLVVALSVFLLFEYTSYLIGGADDTLEQPDAEVFSDPALDTAYLPFQLSKSPAGSRKLRPSLQLPTSCLDAHISKGELCYHPQEPKLDVLWTWVNGSDILLQDAKSRVEDALPTDDPFRPNRSWKQIRQFRLVSTILLFKIIYRMLEGL